MGRTDHSSVQFGRNYIIHSAALREIEIDSTSKVIFIEYCVASWAQCPGLKASVSFWIGAGPGVSHWIASR